MNSIVLVGGDTIESVCFPPYCFLFFLIDLLCLMRSSSSLLLSFSND
jgi:hypothetical protein